MINFGRKTGKNAKNGINLTLVLYLKGVLTLFVRYNKINKEMGNSCSTKPTEVNNTQPQTQVPTNPAEIQNLSNAKYCEDIGELSRAVEYYTLAAQANPRSGAAYRGVANCHSKLGDHTRSIYFYERAIQLDPSNKHCYTGLAAVYQNISKDDSSIKNYNKAIQIDPSFVEAYNGLGDLYYSRKKFS